MAPEQCSCTCRVYFVVDNKYAKQLIQELVRLFRGYNLIGGNVCVDVDFSDSVNVCSEKMGRYVRGAVGDYNLIVVLVDSEGVDPSVVRKRILEEHVGQVDGSSSRVEILIAYPCLEAWLCEAMGIAGCYSGTCGEVVDAIVSRYEGKYEKKALKRMLPALMVRELRRKLGDYPEAMRSKGSRDELVRVLPSQLGELVKEVNAHCTEQQCKS
ncbi:MAG: hypothetical protein ACO2OZ_00310 [Acidilobaceae archaeon]